MEPSAGPRVLYRSDANWSHSKYAVADCPPGHVELAKSASRSHRAKLTSCMKDTSSVAQSKSKFEQAMVAPNEHSKRPTRLSRTNSSHCRKREKFWRPGATMKSSSCARPAKGWRAESGPTCRCLKKPWPDLMAVRAVRPPDVRRSGSQQSRPGKPAGRQLTIRCVVLRKSETILEGRGKS